MSRSKPNPPDGSAPPETDKPEEKKSGRVTFDSRGNAVWEWSMSTGIFGRNVDTKRLKKLEASDLKIVEDPTSKEKTFRLQPAKQAGGGFDPYNSSGASHVPTGMPTPKPRDLRRLSEWIQQQRSLGKKTPEEE
jgi:hypothetical protein